MTKKKALGEDPFGWIPEKGKQDKQSLLNTPNKQKLPLIKRQTYHLKIDLIDKIRDYAYWERLDISEVANTALEEFFRNKKVRSKKK